MMTHLLAFAAGIALLPVARLLLNLHYDSSVEESRVDTMRRILGQVCAECKQPVAVDEAATLRCDDGWLCHRCATTPSEKVLPVGIG